MSQGIQMGMTQSVTTPSPSLSWQRIRDRMGAEGVSLQMRMIDGQLAFPDEEPPEDWREVRVACGAGMVTLRRSAQAVELVIWGNADADLLQAWNAMARAIAAEGGGQVIHPAS